MRISYIAKLVSLVILVVTHTTIRYVYSTDGVSESNKTGSLTGTSASGPVTPGSTTGLTGSGALGTGSLANRSGTTSSLTGISSNGYSGSSPTSATFNGTGTHTLGSGLSTTTVSGQDSSSLRSSGTGLTSRSGVAPASNPSTLGGVPSSRSASTEGGLTRGGSQQPTAGTPPTVPTTSPAAPRTGSLGTSLARGTSPALSSSSTSSTGSSSGYGTPRTGALGTTLGVPPLSSEDHETSAKRKEEEAKKLLDDLKAKVESGLDGKITDQAKLDAAMLKPALEAVKDGELRALVEKEFELASPQLISVDLVSAEAGAEANKLVVTIVKPPGKLHDATAKVNDTELEFELKLDEELGVGATDLARKQKAQDLVSKFSKAASESFNNARYSLLVKALQAKLAASLKENEEAKNSKNVAQELQKLTAELNKYWAKVVNSTASTAGDVLSSDSTEYKSLVVELAKQLEAKLKVDSNQSADQLVESLKKLDTAKLQESLENDEVKPKVLAMLHKELGYSSTAPGAGSDESDTDGSQQGSDESSFKTGSAATPKPAPAKPKCSGKVEFKAEVAASADGAAAPTSASNKNKVTLLLTKPRGKQHEGTAKLAKSDAKGVKEDVEVEVKLDQELVKACDDLESVTKSKATSIAQRVVKAANGATVAVNHKRIVAAMSSQVSGGTTTVDSTTMENLVKELQALEKAKKEDEEAEAQAKKKEEEAKRQAEEQKKNSVAAADGTGTGGRHRSGSSSSLTSDVTDSSGTHQPGSHGRGYDPSGGGSHLSHTPGSGTSASDGRSYSSSPGGDTGLSGQENKNKEGVELDINSKKTDAKWTYSKSGSNNKVHTYEAKDNYGFNKVKQKKTIGKDKDVWSTTDVKLYATKVEYDENNNTTTITLGDGKTKKYKKVNDNWSEETDGQEANSDGTLGSGSNGGGKASHYTSET